MLALASPLGLGGRSLTDQRRGAGGGTGPQEPAPGRVGRRTQLPTSHQFACGAGIFSRRRDPETPLGVVAARTDVLQVGRLSQPASSSRTLSARVPQSHAIAMVPVALVFGRLQKREGVDERPVRAITLSPKQWRPTGTREGESDRPQQARFPRDPALCPVLEQVLAGEQRQGPPDAARFDQDQESAAAGSSWSRVLLFRGRGASTP